MIDSNRLEISPNLSDDFSIPDGVLHVQFHRRLTPDDYCKVAAALGSRPEVELRVYDLAHPEFSDLDFLSYFPDVRRLSIELYSLKNIDGFQAIRQLDEFTFGRTKTVAHSLGFLERLSDMRTLYLEGHKKDIDAITTLCKLQNLTLRSITLPALDLITPLSNLQSLDIKLGGTTNLTALPELKQLNYLELWLIRGLSDLSVLADLGNLENIFLQALKNVTHLPSLRKLKKLRAVHLETMNGLTDLAPIADAPSLEKLDLIDMSSIDPRTLRCFIGHPSLQQFTAGLGSVKRNAYAEALLGLPSRVWLPPGEREKAALEVLKQQTKAHLN